MLQLLMLTGKCLSSACTLEAVSTLLLHFFAYLLCIVSRDMRQHYTPELAYQS